MTYLAVPAPPLDRLSTLLGPKGRRGSLALLLATVLLALGAPDAEAKSKRTVLVSGVAALAAHHPLGRSSVRVETLRGRPLRAASRRDRRARTSAEGAFAIRSARLPNRFVVAVRGGRIRGHRFRGTLRTIVDLRDGAERVGRVEVAPASLGTSVEVAALRRLLRGGGRSGARKTRLAERAALRALGLTDSLREAPAFVALGDDDRSNPRVVAGGRVRRLARRAGGLGTLVRRLARRGLRDRAASLGRRGRLARLGPGRAAASAAGDTVLQSADGCLGAFFETSPLSLSQCAGSLVLSVAGSVKASSTQAQLKQIAGDLSTGLEDLQAIEQRISQLAVDLDDDFLEVLAQQMQTDYDTAAASVSGVVGAIQADAELLETIAAADPTSPAFSSAYFAFQVRSLESDLDPRASGSPISRGSVQALQNATVNTGVAGQGTMLTAWNAIRATQATTGNGALAKSTTLYTPEMSNAIYAVGAYWFNQMWQTTILSANYYNNLFAGGGTITTAATRATAMALGNTTAQGTCAKGEQPPCQGAVTANLAAQKGAIPRRLGARTVIDPSTSTLWALFEEGPSEGATPPSDGDYTGPVQTCPSGATLELQPGYAATVNGAQPAAGCRWAGAPEGGPAGSGLDLSTWSLPTAGWGEQTDNTDSDVVESGQFGIAGDGSLEETGLFAQFGGSQVPSAQQLAEVTSPPAFPLLSVPYGSGGATIDEPGRV